MTDNILRQSQLITTYGPGAMVDLPDYSVIVSGLQEWSHRCREKIEEPRLTAKLRRLLDIPELELWTPPRHEEAARQVATVGGRIFPTWFIVKESCRSPRHPHWHRRRLVRYHHLSRMRFRDDQDGKSKPVVPVRFVCGCRRGHIDDIDWRRFVHPIGKTCHRPLWLEERGTGADISDIFCVCDCGEERSLYEASILGTGALGQCEGKRPWIGQHAKESCGEPYRLLVRTASNAYFPQNMSVISLPETDSQLAERVARYYRLLKGADEFGMLSSFRTITELNAAFEGTDDDSVLAEYRRQKGGGEEDGRSVKAAEFDLLNQGRDMLGQDDSRSRFHAQTLPRSDWDPDQDSDLSPIERVVLVHRLREVVALLGFTRFEAISPDKDGELDYQVIRASLAETPTWLPAVENRGEGIFLSFSAQAIEDWLTKPGVQQRGQRILAGWKVWAAEHHRAEDDFPGLPYMMLHSLSHLLMTSIALDCGYPASSLRERVYSVDSGYGVLIYTGSSDSEGTLGGLIEAGRRLRLHIRRALEDGRLCSNDPVCADHSPDSQLEGRSLLGAACHGCLLIAETSCEQRNDFLDRALVVPTVSVPDAAFFPLDMSQS